AVFTPPLDALRGLPRAVAGSFQDGSDLWLLGAWTVLVLVALGARGRWSLRSSGPMLMALAAYFMAPMSITGQWNIGPRFAVLAALLVIPLAGAEGRRARSVGV